MSKIAAVDPPQQWQHVELTPDLKAKLGLDELGEPASSASELRVLPGAFTPDGAPVIELITPGSGKTLGHTEPVLLTKV